MTTTTQHAPGTFCWPELATSDQAGARKFYTSLFGWRSDENDMGNGQTYTMLKKGDQAVGALYGVSPQEAKSPPHWNSYVAVANVDETARKAKQLGGQVVLEPLDVMEHGRMAVIQDPTGAVFSLWQGKQHIGANLLDEVGALCWTELLTNDTDKAGKFYTSLLPWKSDTQNMAHTKYTMFKRGDQMAAGMLPTPKEVEGMPPQWFSYFAVDNVDQTVSKAQQLGGKVMRPAADIPDMGRFAILQDPQGAPFAIWQYAPQR